MGREKKTKQNKRNAASTDTTPTDEWPLPFSLYLLSILYTFSSMTLLFVALNVCGPRIGLVAGGRHLGTRQSINTEASERAGQRALWWYSVHTKGLSTKKLENVGPMRAWKRPVYSPFFIPDHDFAIYPDWLRRTTAGPVWSRHRIHRGNKAEIAARGDQKLTEDPVGRLGNDSCVLVVDDDDDI